MKFQVTFAFILLLSLFTQGLTLRFKYQHESIEEHQALIEKHLMRWARLSNQDVKVFPTNQKDQSMLTPVQLELFSYILGDETFSQALKNEQELSQDDSDRLKQYFLDNPQAARQTFFIDHTSDDNACWSQLSQQQRDRYMQILISNCDFTTAFMPQGSVYPDGYEYSVNNEIQNDDLLSDVYDQCALIVDEKRQDQSSSSSH